MLFADVISVDTSVTLTVCGWISAAIAGLCFLFVMACCRAPAEGGLVAVPFFIGSIIFAAAAAVCLLMYTWAPIILLLVVVAMFVLMMLWSSRG